MAESVVELRLRGDPLNLLSSLCTSAAVQAAAAAKLDDLPGAEPTTTIINRKRRRPAADGPTDDEPTTTTRRRLSPTSNEQQRQLLENHTFSAELLHHASLAAHAHNAYQVIHYSDDHDQYMYGISEISTIDGSSISGHVLRWRSTE
jgi:hypothetical protein